MIMDTDILQSIKTSLERFSDSTKKNSEDISRVLEDLKAIQADVSKITPKIESITERINNINSDIDKDEGKISDLSIKLAKLETRIETLLGDLSSIKDDAKNHLNKFYDHINIVDKELEKVRGDGNKLIVAIDELKSDMSDTEQSVSELDKKYDTRVGKLESIPNAYLSLKMLGGIIVSVLGAILLGYEFWDKLIK